MLRDMKKEIEKIISQNWEKNNSGFYLNKNYIDQLLALFNSNLKEQRELLEKKLRIRETGGTEEYIKGWNSATYEIKNVLEKLGGKE